MEDHADRVAAEIVCGASCAARDVYELAGEEYGWKPTTVKTYLRLLVNKGYLSTKRIGNSYLYRPKRSLLNSLQRAADSLLEKMLHGADGPLLAYMLKKSRLSEEEIAELRQLLDDFESRVSEE